MRFASVLMVMSLVACATTAHRVPMTDPKTGEIVRDSKGDVVLAKEDEHNYADLTGRGQRDAAEADLIKAKADAVRDFGQVCLERNRIMGRNPADFLGQSFQCEPGHIMATEGGWMAYPMGAPPYMIHFGGPTMNGGYPQSFRDNGPTGQLIMDPRMNTQPISSVYQGEPRTVRVWRSTGHAAFNPSQQDTENREKQKRADNGQGKKQDGNGGEGTELLTAAEKTEIKQLGRDAECVADLQLRDTKECLEAVRRLEVFQDSIRVRVRNERETQLAMRGQPRAVQVVGGGGDGGSGENQSKPEPNMSVNPGNGIWTPADTSPPANRITQE